MVFLYGKEVQRKLRKHQIPRDVWEDFRDAFLGMSVSQNFRLFDVKKMIAKGSYVYYRLRIRNYRALFHMDRENIYVEDIGPRGGVYR